MWKEECRTLQSLIRLILGRDSWSKEIGARRTLVLWSLWTWFGGRDALLSSLPLSRYSSLPSPDWSTQSIDRPSLPISIRFSLLSILLGVCVVSSLLCSAPFPARILLKRGFETVVDLLELVLRGESLPLVFLNVATFLFRLPLKLSRASLLAYKRRLGLYWLVDVQKSTDIATSSSSLSLRNLFPD